MIREQSYISHGAELMPDAHATVAPARPGTGPAPEFAEPTVVKVSRLTANTIAHWNLGRSEYAVLEPFPGGTRARPAGLEDQLRYEQDNGLGRVTYSLGEFLAEVSNLPAIAAPTFNRLAQFKRDYAKLTLPQRELFREAAKRFIAPLTTTHPGVLGEPSVWELPDHPGFFELPLDRDLHAVFTFGRAVRQSEPHVIWCRIGGTEVLDRQTAVHRVVKYPDAGGPAA
jgi:hypothetical protein